MNQTSLLSIDTFDEYDQRAEHELRKDGGVTPRLHVSVAGGRSVKLSSVLPKTLDGKRKIISAVRRKVYADGGTIREAVLVFQGWHVGMDAWPFPPRILPCCELERDTAIVLAGRNHDMSKAWTVLHPFHLDKERQDLQWARLPTVSEPRLVETGNPEVALLDSLFA